MHDIGPGVAWDPCIPQGADMSDDQAWAPPDDSQPTDDVGETAPTDSTPTDDSTPSTEDQEQKGEPELDLSQAQVGQPPEEALAFNDFDTSWTEGVA